MYIPNILLKFGFAEKQSCSHEHTWHALSHPDITDRADNIINNDGGSKEHLLLETLSHLILQFQKVTLLIIQYNFTIL